MGATGGPCNHGGALNPESTHYITRPDLDVLRTYVTDGETLLNTHLYLA